MLLSYLIGGDFQNALITFLVLLFVVMFINPIHEFSHAFAAYKLGDPTAKNSGRLTLNPLVSFDLMGALMFFLVGIGWAKPVPINPNYFKKRKAGTALTAAAGPISNILMAFIFLLVCAGIQKFASYNETVSYVYTAFYMIAQINVLLALFNLIPLPPLDGSRILAGILPDRIYFKLFKYDRYLRNIVLGILVLNILLSRFGINLLYPLEWLESLVLKGLYWLACLPFGLN